MRRKTLCVNSSKKKRAERKFRNSSLPISTPRQGKLENRPLPVGFRRWILKKLLPGVQASCRKVFTGLLGEEKANELTTMKVTIELDNELVSLLGKRHKHRWYAEESRPVYRGNRRRKEETRREVFRSWWASSKVTQSTIILGCRKAFGVEEKKTKRHVYRHRRDHHHEGEQHTLEDLFKTYLSWLTEDQQKELTEFKAAGKARKELHEEIVKYYDNANDSVKEVARQKMQDGCKKM